jgi:phage N-6-adenine-methyltransferase
MTDQVLTTPPPTGLVPITLDGPTSLTSAQPLSKAKGKAEMLARWQQAVAEAGRHPGTFTTAEDYMRHQQALRQCALYLAEAVDHVRRKAASVGGGSQTVCTPKPFFDFCAWYLAENYGGQFVIDLAASIENALCARFFSETDNALAQRWHLETGDDRWGWNNPPFGLIEPWVQFARAETLLGARLAQLLKMAIGAEWFQTHVKNGPCTVLRMAGRLPFIGYGGNGANFDTMLVLWTGSEYIELDWNWRLEMARWALAFDREAEVLAWFSGMRKFFKAARLELAA